MPLSDADLVGLLANRRAPASVYACAIAARLCDGSTAELIRLTGFGKSQVYEARGMLDDIAPGWRPDDTTPAVDVVATGTKTLVPADAYVVPLWRRVLGEQIEKLHVNGEVRSWDLYKDLYAPAADRCLREAKAGDPGELIGLVVDYFENVTGDDVDGTRRRQLAKLVRHHGKVALYAVKEALMKGDIDLDDQRALLQYATVVCQRKVESLRRK